MIFKIVLLAFAGLSSAHTEKATSYVSVSNVKEGGYSYEVIHDYPSSALVQKPPVRATQSNIASVHVFAYDEDGPDVSLDSEYLGVTTTLNHSHESGEAESHSPEANSQYGSDESSFPRKTAAKPSRGAPYKSHHSYVDSEFVKPPKAPYKFGDRKRQPKWSPTASAGGFSPSTAAGKDSGSVQNHLSGSTGKTFKPRKPPSPSTSSSYFTSEHKTSAVGTLNPPVTSSAYSGASYYGYGNKLKPGDTKGQASGPGVQVSDPGIIGDFSYSSYGSSDGRIIVHHHHHKETVEHYPNNDHHHKKLEHYPNESAEQNFSNYGDYLEPLARPPVIQSVKIETTVGHIKPQANYKPFVSSPVDHLTSGFPVFQQSDFHGLGLPAHGHEDSPLVDHSPPEEHSNEIVSQEHSPVAEKSPVKGFPVFKGYSSLSVIKKPRLKALMKTAQFQPGGKRGRWKPVVVTSSKAKGKLRTFRISRNFKPGKLEDGFQPSFGPVPGHYVELDTSKHQAGHPNLDHDDVNDIQPSSEFEESLSGYRNTLDDYLSPPPKENYSDTRSNEDTSVGSKPDFDSDENKSLKDYHNSLTTPSYTSADHTKTGPRLEFHRSKLLSLFPIHVPPLKTTTIDHTIATKIETNLPTVKLSSYLATPPLKIHGPSGRDQATSYANSNGFSLVRPNKRKNG